MIFMFVAYQGQVEVTQAFAPAEDVRPEVSEFRTLPYRERDQARERRDVVVQARDIEAVQRERLQRHETAEAH